ncbi:hypothetical protein YC2023_005452 [Brassica napus]
MNCFFYLVSHFIRLWFEKLLDLPKVLQKNNVKWSSSLSMWRNYIYLHPSRSLLKVFANRFEKKKISYLEPVRLLVLLLQVPRTSLQNLPSR